MYQLRPFWINQVLDAWKKRPVIWVSDVRTVGKTTLAGMFENSVYMNCDLPSVTRRLQCLSALARVGGKAVTSGEFLQKSGTRQPSSVSRAIARLAKNENRFHSWEGISVRESIFPCLDCFTKDFDSILTFAQNNEQIYSQH